MTSPVTVPPAVDGVSPPRPAASRPAPTCPRCRRPLQAIVGLAPVHAMVPGNLHPGALVPGPPVAVYECVEHGLFHTGAR